MNIILIGFMGTGKTSVGKRIARALNWQFIDTDQVIEEVTGMEIKEIFQKYGETRFRSEEAAAVKRVTQENNRVISTGGGVVLNPENLQRLKNSGLVIALNASPEVILERISLRKNRPLLQTPDPLATIIELSSQRIPLYAQAHISVNTDNKSLNEVTDEIIKLYNSYKQEG